MTKPTYTQDYKAIEHLLINQYSEGGKQAKSEIMRPAFHKVATMYNADENGQLSGGAVADTLFPTIDNHFKPSDNPRVAIAYIDISGTAASARVDTDELSGYGFTDYFNLLKIDGKWIIISKIFHAHY
ncbi:putative lumazine-binding protein [Mesocricetibacter intestinalis]|uniref:Putative lumazine-binding protein n=1 Tax=Mesocricetibacter intestinalis TaxID=1521930 RepID=A0A4V3D9S2_9PAST|nr:nuclear transport factor 2 family protein [Mesocricetibacter intestinalis]TDQ57977.1 putative lumazine-binding protein [Mesocricetibacter intestinalis]